MSRSAARARSGQDGTSLYQEITDKIIAELEAGRAPWVQPWGTAAAKATLAMPQNASTQRRYSGINVLILWGAVIERGLSSQSWLTFRQALGLGGNVRCQSAFNWDPRFAFNRDPFLGPGGTTALAPAQPFG